MKHVHVDPGKSIKIVAVDRKSLVNKAFFDVLKLKKILDASTEYLKGI